MQIVKYVGKVPTIAEKAAFLGVGVQELLESQADQEDMFPEGDIRPVNPDSYQEDGCPDCRRRNGHAEGC